MSHPDWRALLREGFDYDLFANRIWLAAVVEQGDEEERGVFKHLMGASAIWETRVRGTSLTVFPDLPLTEATLLDLHGRWLGLLDGHAYDENVPYRNLRGDAYERSFGDIARHVLNHGTYHRGHLRGLFGTRGQAFEDTDYMGFTFQRDGV